MKLALVIQSTEINYAHLITKLLAPRQVIIIPIHPEHRDCFDKLKIKLAHHNCTHVILSHPEILYKLFHSRLLSDYAGTYTTVENFKWLILPPLTHWYSVPYGEHLIRRYVSKISHPEKFLDFPEFSFTLVNDHSYNSTIEKLLAESVCVSVDIETASIEKPAITCVGFSFLHKSGKPYTFCIPIKQYYIIKQICEHPIPKIFQNGKFDISHLLAWRIKTKSYYFDTLNLAHSRYSELPKSLDFIGAYYLREIRFWKSDNSYSDPLAHYEYNARDAYITLCVFISQLHELEDWAIRNYLIQFPKEYICLYMSLQGLPINVEKLQTVLVNEKAKQARLLEEIRKYTSPDFLPSSWQQVERALNAFCKFLRLKKIEGTSEPILKEVAVLHPFLDKFISKILEYREVSKFISTYLEAPLLNNRLYYTIETAATDTGRLASRASFFSRIARFKQNGKPEFVNFGTQIQNIPPKYKELVEAKPNWLFAEIDYAQSESRCTAYLADDEALIDSVENSPDFHCKNASLFFGIPFEKLYDVQTKKKLNKEIRDLAKRVNHGANYNMGPQVLLTTMGLSYINQAKKLLNLPKDWAPIEVAAYLLKCFDVAYPKIRSSYYEQVKQSIMTTKKLVSPLGWTRYCFGDPTKSKLALNAYVAHGPQNLSVQILNEGMVEIFYKLVSPTFRILAQIHDSILFYFEDTEENHAKLEKAKQLLTRPVKIQDKTLVIPPELSKPARIWAEIKD